MRSMGENIGKHLVKYDTKERNPYSKKNVEEKHDDRRKNVILRRNKLSINLVTDGSITKLQSSPKPLTQDGKM